ncbi:MAG: hypothetical protein H6510_07370 [Acidobacteria bacterium]|nr:hypothetical protein [Acidobacteriota bacterium]MCB9397616.1 hypothetical protein [Acidobacteriota bacterium]
MVRIILFLSFSTSLFAQIQVNPSGVNVDSQNPTSVFLTFSNTQGWTAQEAIWCGAVDTQNAPVPGTVFGQLAPTYNLLRPSAGNDISDVMTIPLSVTRAAYQAAARGETSSFFYVRRFVNAESKAEQYVKVTCRLAGGGARVPLSLTHVVLQFESQKALSSFAPDHNLPSFSAELRYTGSGRIQGTWELVTPEDEPPTALDLLPEGSLPPETRAEQRHFQVLGHFDQVLTPTGNATLKGPDPQTLPRQTPGVFQILFRVAASADKEADSQTSLGKVHAGGVAGFPMPVLRYQVLAKAAPSGLKSIQGLLPPKPQAQMPLFQWQPVAGYALLEWQWANPTETLFQARLQPETTSYQPPPWLQQSGSYRWRLIGYDEQGQLTGKSEWRAISLP